uniref:Uncharacterized protein n=1 Tax=Aegilops tauschii subsp. strangulata TaxID=200361 RepID=A0A453G3P9_AEGTS
FSSVCLHQNRNPSKLLALPLSNYYFGYVDITSVLIFSYDVSIEFLVNFTCMKLFMCVMSFQEYSCTYMMWVIQVIIWWPDLMRGVVSIALAYNKGKGWKYADGRARWRPMSLRRCGHQCEDGVDIGARATR